MEPGLGGDQQTTATPRITVQLVQKVVARDFNMTVQQLLERTRRRTTTRPRQIAMYLACKLTHTSLPDIGRRFGDFDHTTVMYARDRIEALQELEPALKNTIETFTRLLRSGRADE